MLMLGVAMCRVVEKIRGRDEMLFFGTWEVENAPVGIC